MPANMVLVTLEKPWAGSKDGRYRMKMGAEPCEVNDESEYGWAGPNASVGADKIRRPSVKPGKPIYQIFDCATAESATALIPVEWAKHYFGDWDCIESRSEAGVVMRRVTGNQGTAWIPAPIKPEEKERVACIFGGYMTKSERGLKEDQIDHTPIGPPNVPHVCIRKTDNLGRPVEGWEYRPHEFFDWNGDFADFKGYDHKKNPPKVVLSYA